MSICNYPNIIIRTMDIRFKNRNWYKIKNACDQKGQNSETQLICWFLRLSRAWKWPPTFNNLPRWTEPSTHLHLFLVHNSFDPDCSLFTVDPANSWNTNNCFVTSLCTWTHSHTQLMLKVKQNKTQSTCLLQVQIKWHLSLSKVLVFISFFFFYYCL